MYIDCQKGLRRAIMSMKAEDVEELIIRQLPVSDTTAILEDIDSKGDINKTERKKIILSYLKEDMAFIGRICDIMMGQVPDETYGYDMYKLAKRVERLGTVAWRDGLII